MSSTSSVPAASGGVVQQSLCQCCDVTCKVNIFIIEGSASGLPSTEKTKCCGFNCNKDVDNSHFCSLCGSNVCALCSIANVNDKNSYEPLLKNVICDKHEQYCKTHNYEYRKEEIPHAISAESTESTVQGGGGAAEVELDVPKTVSHHDVKQALSSKSHNYFPDVLLSHALIHPLAKVAKNGSLPTDPTKLTKLRGVKIPSRGGMVPTHSLNVDNLRLLALHGMKIDKMGNKSKKEICDTTL